MHGLLTRVIIIFSILDWHAGKDQFLPFLILQSFTSFQFWLTKDQDLIVLRSNVREIFGSHTFFICSSIFQGHKVEKNELNYEEWSSPWYFLAPPLTERSDYTQACQRRITDVLWCMCVWVRVWKCVWVNEFFCCIWKAGHIGMISKAVTLATLQV